MAERIANPHPGPPGRSRAGRGGSRWRFPAHGFEKVKVGDKMPAFTLKDTAGADVGLRRRARRT